MRTLGITTKPDGAALERVYLGRVHVGNVVAQRAGTWWWEFKMKSEALNCVPLGREQSRDDAIGKIAQCCRGWLKAAGSEDEVKIT